MGLFRNRATKGPTGNVLPNWSTDPISSQDDLAQTPPELFPLAQQLIERSGRGAVYVALERLYMMIAAQTDAYVSQFPELQKYDFKTIRNELLTRPDFDESTLFSSLTYFGPAGIAMNNGLISQIPAFVEALEQAGLEGNLDA